MLKWTNDEEGELANVSIIICQIEDSFEYRVIVNDEVADGEACHSLTIYEEEGLNKWILFNNALDWIKKNCLPKQIDTIYPVTGQ